jgi:translocation and assembly module TamA
MIGRVRRGAGALLGSIVVAGLWSAPSGAFNASLTAPGAPDTLVAALSNASLVLSAKRDDITDPQDVLASAQADYGRIVSILYEYGYFGPVVSILVDGREAADIPPLSRLTSVQRVDLRVSPGPAFHLGTAQIGPLAPGTDLPAGFRTGAPGGTLIIGETARASVTAWRAIGNAKATVASQDISADHKAEELDVRLTVAPGPRVSFGTLNVAGNSKVKEFRIRDMTGSISGKVFDPVVLERMAARLRRSGAFSSVSVREADTLGPDDTMDIDVTVVDAKPRRFGFGAQIMSTEGLTVSGYWLHRNLFNGAERLRIDGEVSGLGGETSGYDYHLGFNLTRPSTFTTETDLYITGEIEQLDEPLFFSRQANFAVGFTKYFSKELQAELGVGYRFSDVRDSFGSRTFSHLTLPVAVTWDKRDDVLNPTGGFYLRAEGLPYVGLAGSATGGRGYADARIYRGFGADNGVVLAGRLQFGTILGSSIAQTPPDLLFLSGGSGTVRGLPYQSHSVTVGGVETGGRSFIGLAGEARVKVTDRISAVAFYDAGYVGQNSFIDDTGGWQSGAGLGIRYNTGIGPIRLDVATPVQGSASSDIQFYIGIGQAF